MDYDALGIPAPKRIQILILYANKIEAFAIPHAACKCHILDRVGDYRTSDSMPIRFDPPKGDLKAPENHELLVYQAARDSQPGQQSIFRSWHKLFIGYPHQNGEVDVACYSCEICMDCQDNTVTD